MLQAGSVVSEKWTHDVAAQWLSRFSRSGRSGHEKMRTTVHHHRASHPVPDAPQPREYGRTPNEAQIEANTHVVSRSSL